VTWSHDVKCLVARLSLELELPRAGTFEVTALVRGSGYDDGGIGEASLEYMKALKAEVGV
jgi:hypothetical protein